MFGQPITLVTQIFHHHRQLYRLAERLAGGASGPNRRLIDDAKYKLFAQKVSKVTAAVCQGPRINIHRPVWHILYRRNPRNGAQKWWAEAVAPVGAQIYNRHGMEIREEIIKPLLGHWVWERLSFCYAVPNSPTQDDIQESD